MPITNVLLWNILFLGIKLVHCRRKIEDPSPAACCGLLDGRVPAPVPLLRLLAGLLPVHGCMHWANFVKGRVVVGRSSMVVGGESS